MTVNPWNILGWLILLGLFIVGLMGLVIIVALAGAG